METNARFPLVVIRQYVKTIKFIDQSRVLFGAFSRTVHVDGSVNL